MNYSNFKIRFYNDILLTYPNAQLDNNTITITSGHLEISISLSEAYSVLELTCDYNITIERFLKNIADYKNKHKFKIDYNCIYPSIRSKKFGIEEKFPFFREDFFLDLDIMYIQDMGEMFKFLSESDVSRDQDKIKEMALGNLEKTLNPLVQIEPGVDVYAYRFLTDFNAARIILDSEINKVIKTLGDSFIVAIPNTTTIFFAKDNTAYYNLLCNLLEVDSGDHIISDNIYRYNNGTWTLANTEKCFKVIK